MSRTASPSLHPFSCDLSISCDVIRCACQFSHFIHSIYYTLPGLCDAVGMWTCQYPAVSRTRKAYLRREVVGHWHTLDAWALLEKARERYSSDVHPTREQPHTSSSTPRVNRRVSIRHSAVPSPRPAWRDAAVGFGDWLVHQQAANGSWPRAYQVVMSSPVSPRADLILHIFSRAQRKLFGLITVFNTLYPSQCHSIPRTTRSLSWPLTVGAPPHCHCLAYTRSQR